ncbi:hypothetical protein EDB80DRAFT_826229 [Ilyonectria destructans]|nr:hypothetical protein EDB80DRAFT_826229 [Ilyonectria destructans]
MCSFRQLSNYFITEAEEACADDMVNREVGYSFVSNTENGLTKCTRLFGNGQWSWSAVTEYLKAVTRLEEMILGSLYTACGQASRLTELLSIGCENSPSAIYSIFHYKAKRSTNREFYVVRFLPVRLGMVVVKYLICIRWMPESDLSARQLAIGITEKHVREVHSSFNRYDDCSAEADLNVTFAWQSGHRPLQRGVVYGLDGAFPHRLQPSLLRAYEWASTR